MVHGFIWGQGLRGGNILSFQNEFWYKDIKKSAGVSPVIPVFNKLETKWITIFSLSISKEWSSFISCEEYWAESSNSVCLPHAHTRIHHIHPPTLFLSYLFDMAQGLDDSESLKFFLKTSSVNQKILISKAPSHVLGSHEIWELGYGNPSSLGTWIYCLWGVLMGK